MTFRIWLRKDTRPSCQGCYLPGLMAFLGLDGKDCCLKKTSGVWWRKTGNEPQIRVMISYLGDQKILLLSCKWNLFIFNTFFLGISIVFSWHEKYIFMAQIFIKTETCYEGKYLEPSSTILGRTMFEIFNINSEVVNNYLVLLSVSLSKFQIHCV